MLWGLIWSETNRNSAYQRIASGKELTMRKIIKHGNVQQKQEKLYHFRCERCGCEWIADSNSISSHVGGMGHIWISSNCPDCDKIESVDTAIL